MAVTVVPVGSSRRDRGRFWSAGLGPYQDDPHFVVPLRMDCFDRWAPGNPVREHVEIQHFVAVRAGRDVGRIAAAVDRMADRTRGDRVGNFGWFETEPREETAHALLDAAAAWLRERGRSTLRGPLSYTANGMSGLLVEDLEPGPAVIDMPYNPLGYAGLLESWGLGKGNDLLAFWVPTGDGPPQRFARIVKGLRKRGRVTVRPFHTDRAGFMADVDHVLAIYNQAWAENWGFVPMTQAEMRHQARSFRPLVRPELTFFASVDGEEGAFLLALPDVNEALAKIRGRLWPWAAFRFLRALKGVRRVRTITLGVLPRHRRRGLEAILIHDLFRACLDHGIEGGECSWVLEDNELMVAGIREAGGRLYRRYRVFEKSL